MTITPPYPQQLAELDQQVLDGILSPEDYGRSLPDFSYAILANGKWYERNSFCAENPLGAAINHLSIVHDVDPDSIDPSGIQVWAMSPHESTTFKLVWNGVAETNLQSGLTKQGFIASR